MQLHTQIDRYSLSSSIGKWRESHPLQVLNFFLCTLCQFWLHVIFFSTKNNLLTGSIFLTHGSIMFLVNMSHSEDSLCRWCVPLQVMTQRKCLLCSCIYQNKKKIYQINENHLNYITVDSNAMHFNSHHWVFRSLFYFIHLKDTYIKEGKAGRKLY